MDMITIEKLTREFRSQRDVLSARIQALEEAKRKLVRQALPAVRGAVHRAQSAEADLRAALEAAPELFDKPRTQVMHGVRVGYTKGKGRLVIADESKTLDLIGRHFPEHAEVLIRERRTVVKEALGQLTASELKRVGVHIEQADDQVVIRCTDSELDRLVTALMQDSEAVEEAVA